MENTPRNGLREDEDEDFMFTEEDVVAVADDEPRTAEGDVANELDELDMDDSEAGDGDEEAITIEPERDDSKVVFKNHTGSVFCVDVDQEKGELAVTGGEDDKAYLWKLATGEVLLECTGHKDSVTCVAFSPGSAYVATGDLSGFVQVWSVEQLKRVWSFEVSDLEWLTWHHGAPVLLAGTVDGDMWMWKIPSGDCKTFQSFGHACNQGMVLPDGKQAVAGYEDGSVRVWDLKSVAPVHTFTGRTGHRKSVTSISCHKDNNLMMTCSTDGTALLMNTAVGKTVGKFQCSKTSGSGEGANDDSVETGGFSNSFPFAATGTLSGSLSIWDVPTQVCRQKIKHEAGIVKLYWHETQPLVYTCSLDGAIYLWDSRSGHQERQFLGHEAPILDLQVLRKGNTFVTSSDDHTARVYSSS